MNMDIAHNPSQQIGETSNDMPELQKNIINQLDLTFNSSILDDLSCNIPLTGVNTTAMEEDEEEDLPHDILEDMPTFGELITSTPIVEDIKDKGNDKNDAIGIKIEETQLQTQIFTLKQSSDEEEKIEAEDDKEEEETIDEQIFKMGDSDNETIMPTSLTVMEKESFGVNEFNIGAATANEKSFLNLSNSLIDHNYSTLIESPTTDALRNYLNNHLIEKANYANEKTQVKLIEFVEEIMSSINSFSINQDSKNDHDEQLDFELFVQKVIDSVMPLDESLFEEIKQNENNNNNNNNNKEENHDEVAKSLIKQEERKKEAEEEKELELQQVKDEKKAAILTDELQELNLDELQTIEQQDNKYIVLDKLMKFGQILQDKCKSLISSSSIDNVTDFVDMQLKDFQNLIKSKTTSSVDSKFCEISVQTEPSKRALRRMKKELELQSKFKLENGTSSSSSESSDSSSNSSTSSTSNTRSLCSNSSCDQLLHATNKKKRKKGIQIEDNKLDTTTKTTKMEIDEEENQGIESNTAADDINVEDKEIDRLINFDGLLKRPKYIPGVSVPVKSLENSKQKVKLLAKDLLLNDSNSEEDESDDDEAKPFDEDGKLTDDKLKKFANACNGEEAIVKQADDESEKETITEKEYLKRYNDSLKQHFLNDSSSMSEDTSEVELIKGLCPEEENADDVVDKFLESYDAEQDDFAEVSQEEEEEDLVAKDKDRAKKKQEQEKSNTLKDVKDKEPANDAIDDDDNDNDDEITAKQKNSELKTSLSEFIQLPKSPIEGKSEVEADVGATTSPVDKLLDENKKDESGSAVESNLSSSDCELLNDTSLLTKTKKSKKSLEIMLTEAEKRKKASKVDSSDLISLSSASSSAGNSDAEDGEGSGPGHQSRVIKPMLRQDQLASETRRAQKLEADRIRRLDKKQTSLTKILKERNAKNELRTDKEHELILDYNSETKTFIKVHPHIVRQLKSHQIDGIKFMYDSCYGGVDALKKSTGSGCILAHCMGLGKTLQLIALLHTVISYKELKTNKILVLCPKSTVMNWADEIIRWLGPLNAKNLKVFTFSDTSDINEKLRVLRDWSLSTPKRAGCLLIGYEAFRSLVFYHSYKNRGNYGTTYMEEIREKVENYLLKPGADLVVCDEGHIIKNSKSAISLAVSKIVTTKRIILTGTPIQNNLKEYYSMVNFIKPLFLGTEKEFANLYANPIKNGQHKDSSKRDIQVMKQRSFVLHKKLSKFVQRKEAELLKTFLPKKFEYVLFIPMSDVQNNLYEHILEAIGRREENRGRSLITDYTCLRKIWTHPKVLEDAWTNAINQKNKKELAKKLQNAVHSDEDQPDDIYDSQTGVMSVTNDWWRQLIMEKDLETILPSNKLRTMFEILRMCEEKDEKCLIFSAFVAVLNVVEFFLKKINSGDPITLKELNIAPTSKLRNKWVLGQDYYRLDGKTAKNLRHEMVKRFNASSNRQARVFLISAKAGGQGINLIGANRVIILDTSWNPSNDQQNIFRIFRLGQKKNCYIYRVLAMGTMEEKVYSRSVTKQAMSFRVVDEQQIDRHYSMAELAELYTLTKPNPADRPMPIFPQDSILASLLLNFPDMVYKYHEHDSLLENKVEQELSEQEKADAWAAYERDLQITSEIQEPANMEGMRNNFNMPQLRNYFGLDMQTMLNYGNLTNPAATSPFMQSLLAQYNYPGTSQQYLEMLNLYSKYAQSPLSYPELNAPGMGAGIYPTNSSAAHFAAGPTKSTALQANTAVAAGLPNNNPLSALGDLTGLYGMGGAGKNYPHGMGMGGKPNSTASSMYMPHAGNGAATGTATPNIYADNNSSMLLPPPSAYSNSGLGSSANNSSGFKPTVPFSNLYNFNADYPQHRTSNSAMNYASNAANMHLTPLLNSTTNQHSTPPPPPTSSSTPSPFSLTTSNATNLSKGNNNTISMPSSARTIDLTKIPMEYNKNSQPPPLVDLTRMPFKDTSSSSSSNNRNIKSLSSSSSLAVAAAPTISTSSVNVTAMPTLTSSNVGATTKRPSVTKDTNRTHAINEMQKITTTTTTTPVSAATTTRQISQLSPIVKTTINTSGSINNRGIIRPVIEPTVKKINNEMLIIPTTSPPGPTSISKQFTEISPSISLTAVRSNNNNNTNQNKSNTSNVNTPTLTTINNNNNNSSSSSSNKNLKNTPMLLPINNLPNKTINKSPSNNAAISSLKLYRPGMKQSQVQQQQPQQMVTTTAAAALAKTNTTPSTSASNKNNTKILSSSLNDNTSGSGINKNPTITVAKFANMATRRTNTPTNSNIKIISNTNNNAAAATPGTPKTTNAITSTPINTAKKAYMNATAAKSPALSSNTTTTTNSSTYPPLVNINEITTKGNNNAKSSTVGRSGTTISPALTAVQLQKIRAIGASTPPGGINNKNISSNRSGIVRSNTSGISIRPVEIHEKNNKNPNVIIETNINDKRVAIGAPNKSGNGTTVTKISVPLKRKRPNAETVETTTDSSKRRRE